MYKLLYIASEYNLLYFVTRLEVLSLQDEGRQERWLADWGRMLGIKFA